MPIEVARAARTRAGDVADSLRAQILTGELSVGEKLPSENVLTATFEVSRSVVREALQHLQASGLVESFQGRGTYVLNLPEPTAVDGTEKVAFNAVSLSDAADLLEFRIGVESEAAALAAVRATDLQRKGISRALQRFKDSAGRPQDVIPADYDLHLRISTASGNKFFRENLLQLGPRMIMIQRAALQEGVEVTNPVHFERVCGEHQLIVDAVLARDPLAAAAAMRMHLARSKDSLRRR
ncbi:MAG TPA: FadR/GntR family transcriptional regulator [Propionibacteriaceae bacterium]|nr:FadR/GntR family transcriptional regulator [Propionibacteriaceae bacterium]